MSLDLLISQAIIATMIRKISVEADEMKPDNKVLQLRSISFSGTSPVESFMI